MKTKKLLFSSLLVISILTFSWHYSLAQSHTFIAKGSRGDGELKSAGQSYGQYTSDKTQEAKSFNKGALGGGPKGYQYVTNTSKDPGKRGAKGAVDGQPDATGVNRGNTFTTTVLGDIMRIGQTYDGDYEIYKAYLSFNTSAIPNDAVIESVDLILYGEGIYIDGNVTFDIQVVKSVYTDPLWNPDFGSITSGPLGSLPVSQFKVYDGANPDSGKNLIPIVGVKADSLINQGGDTRIALISSRVTEVTNADNPTGPAGKEYVTIFSSDASNIALRPSLNINYIGDEFKVIPLLTWVPGDPEFSTKGVNKDRINLGTNNLLFRVRYISEDGTANGLGLPPSTAKVLIDRNGDTIDDSASGVDLIFDMEKIDPTDNNYRDGVDYQTSVEVTTTSKDELGYQFLFTSSNGKIAQGVPATINRITTLQEDDDSSKTCFISSTHPVSINLWLLGIIMSLGLVPLIARVLREAKMIWESEKQ